MKLKHKNTIKYFLTSVLIIVTLVFLTTYQKNKELKSLEDKIGTIVYQEETF